MSRCHGAAVGLTLAVGLGLSAALALPARAQQQIPIGTSVTGQVQLSDPVLNDQTHYKLFTFMGTAGQTVQIDLLSADFDAYLYLRDQNGQAIAHDDDGGGGHNARITQTLTYTGMYQILANTVGQGENGAFTLQVRATTEVQPGAQQIPIGTQVSSQLMVSDPTLPDGSHYKLFTFMGTAGQTVQIDMISTAFDSYLYLRNQSGNSIAHDDDGGGNLNARIVQMLPYTGMYQIVANTLASGQFGAFTLQLQATQAMTTMQPMVSAIPSINSLAAIGQVGLNQQVQNTLIAGGTAWNNKPIHLYGFQCTAGQATQMDLLSSWDNYLIVFDPNGTEVAHDDDGGEGLNARLRFSCPTTGIYRLGVTTGLASTTPGAYTLQVQAMGQPMQMQPTPQPIMQPTPQPIGQPKPPAAQQPMQAMQMAPPAAAATASGSSSASVTPQAARPGVGSYTAGLAMPPYAGTSNEEALEYGARLGRMLDSTIVTLVGTFRNTSGQPMVGASSPATLSQRERERWVRCRDLYWDLTTYAAAVGTLRRSLGPDPALQHAAADLDSAFSKSVAVVECDNVASMIAAPDRWTPWQDQYEAATHRFYRDFYGQIRDVHEKDRALVSTLNRFLPEAYRMSPPSGLPGNPPYAGTAPS